ncbi:DUF262 domain-containing protein [Nitrosomonas nitrosa]|uniref:Uncharacterized conserved protein, contains ParB-like and HNH nuclease domains n=1 Tax=Nitrosomonas nitrosa TaxID=52442 RepID=A0A1I4TNK8_9PROT|nr:DUF262 domain-containing protein [Nitrosomonas nitrosa]MCO6433477.1 DUF262 domain-containing protein [Nitrosomonas nitrosa]SFM78368.1 Uncharacterized conserved protein, contains ParB-like and HNH nuclease domains [Nitrosomonas nitrosa]
MAELHVSKKSISKLFSEMQDRKFIIPDFQRPYKWDVEKCETLWNDVENFTITDAKTDSDYFLGTIVSYINNEKNLEIIDGQQRITSFFLLLRAFFRKLEDMNEDEDVIGLKNQLAPCIWDINPISQKVSEKTKIHIESLVATEEDNNTFHKILETGRTADSATDNYSVNYRYFKKQCDEYAENNPMQWKQLCVTILQKCIILPIECDTSETALTIFSTLNDRGLPLADSDIFKAQIYRYLETESKRQEFTNTWKELTQICKDSRISIDDVFRYYSHVLRARDNDKSKEVGLRKFYAENKYSRLKDESIINEIMLLANFWRYININKPPEDEVKYVISLNARKYLHCLTCYPNEFWKYATSVFFLKNKDSETFDIDFCKMLQKLVAFLFTKFIEAPTVNAIKDDIYTACISLQNQNQMQFKLVFNEELLGQQIDNHSSSKLSRALLLLDAYLFPNQKELIPGTFDIEHIFPKKWQDTNYHGWDKKDADLYLDSFGNKIVFEKKLNIQAGNGYFGIKKQKYKDSKVACVLDLSKYHKNDWMKDDIQSREANIKSNLISFFKEQLS